MQSIAQWLGEIGLEQYAASFESNDVDLTVLPTLTEADLQHLGVSLGHRRRMMIALRACRAAPPAPASVTPGTKMAPTVHSSTAEGERRQVTVLFCDLVGSTELSHRLDPEEYRSVLARYHETCVACVQNVEGFVAQIQGDGVLAYFGYPLAHESEAERAIQAALSIVHCISTLDAGLDSRLRVRIGVASGLVVVSHVLAQDRTAVGETPNLAQRLQSLAQPGEVLLAGRTRALAAGAFEYEDRGMHTLKGLAEPAHVWKVLGPSMAASRFDAATSGRVTPMVGREQEIALLLDRWDLARAGTGQVVLLRGDPGIGKSRLLRAFRQRIAPVGETALQYQCSPFHTNSAFHPIADHLQRAFMFQRNDSVEKKLEKMESLLIGDLGRNRTDCHLLARAMCIPCESRYGVLEMSLQLQKDETIALMVDIVVRDAEQKTTAVLFEDVHWADPTTREVLDGLVRSTEKRRLLVLLTYRPEFQHAWADCPHVSVVGLNNLTRAQGASIVLGISEDKPMPSDLVTQIVDKTDGVPLFLEELTKAVLESDVLVETGGRYDYPATLQKVAIPVTLRDSLMTRLDRLIPVKEIAQVGSVLGREFSYEMVRAISPMSEVQLQDALEKLAASQLVFQRGTAPDAVYVFKHALVQDAAYDSLLKSKRQMLHAQIAEAIRVRFPSKAETEPELLAHHFTEAGMLAAAIPCWQKAGQNAQQRTALQEAIRHYERGLELTTRLASSPERDVRELQLRALLGMTMIALYGYTNAQAAASLELAWRLDQSLDQGDYTVRILWGLWVFRLCTGQIAESLLWAERLLGRAEEIDSETMRIVGHWTACNSYFFLGELPQCVRHANALLNHYDPVRDAHIADLVNHDPRTVALEYRAGAEWMLGFPAQAAATAEQAIFNAAERKHPFDRCFARHFVVLFVYGPRGDLDRAAALTSEMEIYATEQRLVFSKEVHAPMNWAMCMVCADRYAEARVACKGALERWVAAGLGVAVPHFKAAQAESALRCDDQEESVELLEEALAQIERPECREQYALAEVLRVKALALAGRGEASAAEALYGRALEIARQQSAKSWELRTATCFARHLQEQGRRTDALTVLKPVYGWFTEGHDTKDLREASALLAELQAGEIVRADRASRAGAGI